MDGLTFDKCISLIKNNVDLYLLTGDTDFMEATKPVWRYLQKEGKADMAGQFFGNESLQEMAEHLEKLNDLDR